MPSTSTTIMIMMICRTRMCILHLAKVLTYPQWNSPKRLSIFVMLKVNKLAFGSIETYSVRMKNSITPFTPWELTSSAVTSLTWPSRRSIVLNQWKLRIKWRRLKRPKFLLTSLVSPQKPWIRGSYDRDSCHLTKSNLIDSNFLYRTELKGKIGG